MAIRLLTLIRHAKATPEYRGERGDFGRHLAPRGERDVVRMGQRLLAAGLSPDLVLTSGAKRARQTAEAIAREIGYPPEKIQAEDGLYLASGPALLDRVRETDRGVEHLVLVGHNPGISDLWDWLVDDDGPGLPTCGIARLEIETDSWFEVMPGGAVLLDFDTPKRAKAEARAEKKA